MLAAGKADKAAQALYDAHFTSRRGEVGRLYAPWVAHLLTNGVPQWPLYNEDGEPSEAGPKWAAVRAMKDPADIARKLAGTSKDDLAWIGEQVGLRFTSESRAERSGAIAAALTGSAQSPGVQPTPADTSVPERHTTPTATPHEVQYGATLHAGAAAVADGLARLRAMGSHGERLREVIPGLHVRLRQARTGEWEVAAQGGPLDYLKGHKAPGGASGARLVGPRVSGPDAKARAWEGFERYVKEVAAMPPGTSWRDIAKVLRRHEDSGDLAKAVQWGLRLVVRDGRQEAVRVPVRLDLSRWTRAA